MTAHRITHAAIRNFVVGGGGFLPMVAFTSTYRIPFTQNKHQTYSGLVRKQRDGARLTNERIKYGYESRSKCWHEMGGRNWKIDG